MCLKEIPHLDKKVWEHPREKRNTTRKAWGYSGKLTKFEAQRESPASLRGMNDSPYLNWSLGTEDAATLLLTSI